MDAPSSGALGWDIFQGGFNDIMQIGNWYVNQRNLERSWRREDTAVSRRAADMERAGLNPLLAVGAPAASSMQELRPPQIGSTSLMERLMLAEQMKQMKAGTDQTVAETEFVKQQTQMLTNQMFTEQLQQQKMQQEYAYRAIMNTVEFERGLQEISEHEQIMIERAQQMELAQLKISSQEIQNRILKVEAELKEKLKGHEVRLSELKIIAQEQLIAEKDASLEWTNKRNLPPGTQPHWLNVLGNSLGSAVSLLLPNRNRDIQATIREYNENAAQIARQRILNDRSNIKPGANNYLPQRKKSQGYYY